MNDTFREAIATHTKAVIDLLLGNRKLCPPMAVMAGESLDEVGRMAVAEMAGITGTDILYLEYAPGHDGDGAAAKLLGVNVVAERDARIYFQRECALWLGAESDRGLILPHAASRGHFRLTPSEFRHIDGKPAADCAEGIARAEAWIARRIGSGLAGGGGTRRFNMTLAA